MIRKAFVMQVYANKHQEYQKRHSPIWSELEVTLKQHGAHHYSIFLDQQRNLLFGYVEIESEQRWAEIAQTAICQKWWHYMAEVMPTNSDKSPLSDDLLPVFYLD